MCINCRVFKFKFNILTVLIIVLFLRVEIPDHISLVDIYMTSQLDSLLEVTATYIVIVNIRADKLGGLLRTRYRGAFTNIIDRVLQPKNHRRQNEKNDER